VRSELASFGNFAHIKGVRRKLLPRYNIYEESSRDLEIFLFENPLVGSAKHMTLQSLAVPVTGVVGAMICID
jgi:hypothetical protein